MTVSREAASLLSPRSFVIRGAAAAARWREVRDWAPRSDGHQVILRVPVLVSMEATRSSV
jgi:hypothetical protein